jgi:C4-dicarboxylate-specific signal transduction histidine kinase
MPKGHFVLVLAGSGLGIDPAHAAELLDAFLSTKPGGMGMGLALTA